MLKTLFVYSIISLVFLLCSPCHAQDSARIQRMQQSLSRLSANVPGLKQKVQLSISGLPLQEYLAAMARSNNLSISTDPKLNVTIKDVLTEVTPVNVLIYLARKYDLDVQVVGSIIMVSAYRGPDHPVFYTKLPNIKYRSQDNSLSFSLNDDSLADVARAITQLSNRNVIAPTNMQGKRVTAFIQNAPFETGLEQLAFTNGFRLVKTSENYYIFQSLADGEELYVNAENKPAVRHTYRQPAAGAATYANISTKVVSGQKLVSADASNTPIADLIQRASESLNISYSIYSDIKGVIKLHVNDLPYDDFLGLLFNGTDYTFHKDHGVYLMGDRKIEGLRSFKAIHLEHRAIDTIISMVPSALKAKVEVKEFREQNTILLAGSPSQISEIENIIQQLDKLVPVVLIEVTLLDIHNTHSIATGITAGTSDSIKTGGTILPGFNYTFNSKSISSFLTSFLPVNLGHVSPNFYVSLKALEQHDNVDVRATPKLTALNGHTANLSIGNTVYYKSTTQNLIPYATSSQTIFVNNYTPSKADLSIDIKPVVSLDQQVTLTISVNISSFTSLPSDGSPPPMSTSKFESSIRVNNEDMIVLGGIERSEKDENVSGFPILSRIPVLKWLFSSRTKSNSKVVTLVFIKPSILH